LLAGRPVHILEERPAEGDKEMPMTTTRALTGFTAVALLALAALVPVPAAAGPTVYSADMVCADVVFGGPVVESIALPSISIIQNLGASAKSTLTLTGAGNANLSLTIKAQGLPPGGFPICAAVCVVNGIIELFAVEGFEPCGTITAGGKLTFTGTVPFLTPSEFESGCLLPIPALLVLPEVVPVSLDSVSGQVLACLPGFGQFEPVIIEPEPCLTDC
jgi:hypothetical protein